MSRNHDLLFYGTALNLSIKFPSNLTKNTFCLPFRRPHRAYLRIYGCGGWTLQFTRLIAQSEFETAPDSYWNIPSAWQKLCRRKGLTDMAISSITAQVTRSRLSREKEDYCRVRSCSSNSANEIQGHKSLLQNTYIHSKTSLWLKTLQFRKEVWATLRLPGEVLW